MSEFERVEIPVGEFVFDARAAGPPDGELVLLLHGFPQTSWEWRSQLQALGDAGYRVVAPDQRGYSRRARPEGVVNYEVQHLVADVLAIADWLGGHQFHLVGHDWGAAVAWAVGGTHQERLRTLNIVSVPHPKAFAMALESKEQQDRSSYITVFRQEGKAEELLSEDDFMRLRVMLTGAGSPEDAEEYVRVLKAPGALTAALNWYRAMKPGLVGDIGAVTVPTMFVWSTNDPALGREGAEATGQFVDGPYRFEILEGISHWIPEQAADELNRLLLEHISSAA
ncbi:MAG: alpha/beta hydrolase [Acidimicrobiia bacterium]|nr:alpha/beta hydrolase [Acidimicrobiia bacterium]MBV8983325.1 alpha/beta hydrolase [Acidimicrobiia bacterium]